MRPARALQRLGLIASVIAVTGGTALGTAGRLPEPRALIGATWNLHWHCGAAQECGSITGCNGPYFRTEPVLRGPEADASARPHPQLDGKLTLRISITGDGRKAEGTVTATLRDNDGNVLYRGEGPVVAATDHKGGLVERGVLAATIYDTNGPTDRQLIANFAYRISDQGIVGGLGGGALESPSWAVETNGKTC